MPDVWSIATILAKFGLYLGVLTAAGTVFAAAMFKLEQYRKLALGFAVVGLVSSIAAFSLGGAMLTGDASGLIDPEMLGLLWSTPVGTAFAYRLAGLGLIVFGVMLKRGGLLVSLVGAIAALLSLAQIGHIPDRENIFLVSALFVHLAAVALWVGILTPLDRLAQIPDALKEAATLGHQFGKVAAITVPLLIVAGIAMSYQLVGSATALTTSGYGQALLLKVALVAGLLGLAAANKLRFVPRMQSGDPDAAAHLSRSITLEWLVVAIVLATTAILTSTLTVPT